MSGTGDDDDLPPPAWPSGPKHVAGPLPPTALSRGARIGIGLGITAAVLGVFALVAAVVVPEVRTQRASEVSARLPELARAAADEVRAEASRVDGGYVALDDDIYRIVDRTLAARDAPDSISLVRSSFETFWSRDTFSICLEDATTGRSVTYRSDEGLLPLSDDPCWRS